MNKIIYENGPLTVETSLSSVNAPARVINQFAYGKERSLAILSSDEVVFFFAYEDLLGGVKLDQEASLRGDLKESMKAFLEKEHADPKKVICYFAPSLTFSHVHVERSLQEELIERGYRAACKRTDRVDFLDLPLLNLLYLRELGIPMANIEVSGYGTFETPYLASKANGKEGENLNLANLR
ncbi:MAG: laccase domain-containing protein [Bacilli bacterium]|nr:laccase domain-containing protein [Bacilli bacterium]